jgi:hypothetical protein
MLTKSICAAVIEIVWGLFGEQAVQYVADQRQRAAIPHKRRVASRGLRSFSRSHGFRWKHRQQHHGRDCSRRPNAIR